MLVNIYTHTQWAGVEYDAKAEGHMTNFEAPILKLLEAICVTMCFPLTHPCFTSPSPTCPWGLLAACPRALSWTLTLRLPSAAAFLSQDQFSGHLTGF